MHKTTQNVEHGPTKSVLY